MPIIWRFLIKAFLKITLATLLAFIAILLTMRLEDIAHFAGLGAPIYQLLLFTLYQIPYILPIALPLSCLVASSILVQQLSNSHELTALRASGFSLSAIFTPIFLTAAFLSIVNFWIISEVATRSHFQSNRLKSELRAINPLLLLHNKQMMRLKGFYFESFGTSHLGESASDVVLGLPNHHRQRIHLMVAKQLSVNPDTFSGNQVSFITASPAKEEGDFDHLLIENMKSSTSQTADFSLLLQKKMWRIQNDYLHLPLLIQRIKEQLEKYQAHPVKENKKQLHKGLSEIVKRFSIALAVLSFTFMGSIFAINISRRKSFYPLLIVVGLTTLYLVGFFIGKNGEENLWIASSFFIIPQVLIISASLFFLKRINQGIELW